MIVTHCIHCGEPLEPENCRVDRVHNVCAARLALGSVAHQLGRCGCFVAGSEEHDPENMTRRQAAELAVAIYENGGKLPPGRLTLLYLASMKLGPTEKVM